MIAFSNFALIFGLNRNILPKLSVAGKNFATPFIFPCMTSHVKTYTTAVCSHGWKPFACCLPFICHPFVIDWMPFKQIGSSIQILAIRTGAAIHLFVWSAKLKFLKVSHLNYLTWFTHFLLEVSVLHFENNKRQVLLWFS